MSEHKPQGRPQGQGRPEPAGDKAIFPPERKITFGEKPFTIRPLVLGQFKRLITELGEIAQSLAEKHPDLDLEHPERHLDVLFGLIGAHLGRLLAETLGVEEAWLDDHLDFAAASEIVVAMIEVNRVPVIVGNVLRARRILAEQKAEAGGTAVSPS